MIRRIYNESWNDVDDNLLVDGGYSSYSNCNIVQKKMIILSNSIIKELKKRFNRININLEIDEVETPVDFEGDDSEECYCLFSLFGVVAVGINGLRIQENEPLYNENIFNLTLETPEKILCDENFNFNSTNIVDYICNCIRVSDLTQKL